MYRRVSPKLQTLAEARVSLRLPRDGVDRAIALVDPSLKHDPGLLFERMRWRRRKGRTIEAFEILKTLKAIKEAGLKTAIPSNGEPSMLQKSLKAAGIRSPLDETFSIKSVGIFKTRPSVYDYAANALDVSPNRSAFQSANGWDIVGAAAFGFTTIWINRAGLMEERPSASRAATLPSSPGLPALLGIASEK